MPLDPKVKAMLDVRAALPSVEKQTVAEARATTIARVAAVTATALPVASVTDRSIPGPGGSPMAVRIYTPLASGGTGPHPLMVFFHGSGFVICNLDTHDAMCRNLCSAAGIVVVSVDYRLAPEHKFPAASDDCFAATQWAVAHAAELGADPARVVIAGDSAGGNLAAVTALRARESGGPALRGQLLLYPVTDYHTPGTPSYRDNAEGYGLTREAMKWFWGHYLARESDADNPYASPLKAADFRGLPAALVITAEYDVLRDEGERYAERLREAGVPVQMTRYDGHHHGFFNCVGTLPRADDALAECAGLLKAVLR